MKKTNQTRRKKDNRKSPGYPSYPANEDIYRRDDEEEDIDPEDSGEIKEPFHTEPDDRNHEEDMTGSDLDVPGSELDDEEEDIGEEDEENNYYSLGGDKHDS
jgi:hypothetical protein